MTTGWLGPYTASDFVPVRGRDARHAHRAARWYFDDAIVAAPVPGVPAAAFARGIAPFSDVRQWAAAGPPLGDDTARPPLIALGAAHRLRDVRLEGDRLRTTEGRSCPVALAQRLPSNRAWWDARSTAFMGNRPLVVRGAARDDGFVLCSAWPDDVRLGPTLPPARSDSHPAASALRDAWRDTADAALKEPWTLWERAGAPDAIAGRGVLAFVVNGAQGDDDEAHAGHFALATGVVADDGSIADWLVDNFYALDVVSEKGILAAPTPLDAYHGDLNRGQSWYRPTLIVAAIVRTLDAPRLVQGAQDRLYAHFWRHRLDYYHPDRNCTSIAVDALRALGLAVERGAREYGLVAALALPWLALRERSIARARLSVDYALADPVRLLPQVALDACVDAVLRSVHGEGDGPLARLLARDLDALAVVPIPQFPSSRRAGREPVASLAEYASRVPRDPAEREIVPVPPRPFPAELRDDDLVAPPPPPSAWALRTWIAGAALLAFGVGWWVLR